MKRKIQEVLEIIKKTNNAAYLVGGSSRDILLSRDFLDVDITTSCDINKICKEFEVIDKSGISFGSVKIKYKGVVMEITQFRIESYDDKSIFPHIVCFTDDPKEDSKRRDFTINAIYLDLTNNTIIDDVGGINDLMNHKIRFIGNPSTRIKEDPTRIIRALRFAYKLRFDIEEKTSQAIKDNINELNRITKSKLQKEIEKLYNDLGTIKGQKILDEYGIIL